MAAVGVTMAGGSSEAGSAAAGTGPPVPVVNAGARTLFVPCATQIRWEEGDDEVPIIMAVKALELVGLQQVVMGHPAAGAFSGRGGGADILAFADRGTGDAVATLEIWGFTSDCPMVELALSGAVSGAMEAAVIAALSASSPLLFPADTCRVPHAAVAPQLLDNTSFPGITLNYVTGTATGRFDSKGSGNNISTRFSLKHAGVEVGWGLWSYHHFESSGADTAGPVLEHIEVTTEYRSSGLGSALYKAMEAAVVAPFARLGRLRLHAEAAVGSEFAARFLCGRAGFEDAVEESEMDLIRQLIGSGGSAETIRELTKVVHLHEGGGTLDGDELRAEAAHGQHKDCEAPYGGSASPATATDPASCGVVATIELWGFDSDDCDCPQLEVMLSEGVSADMEAAIIGELSASIRNQFRSGICVIPHAAVPPHPLNSTLLPGLTLDYVTGTATGDLDSRSSDNSISTRFSLKHAGVEVGWALWAYHYWEADYATYAGPTLEHIQVATEYQGQGLGAAFYNATEAAVLAPFAPLARVRFYIDTSAVAAVRFLCEHAGFADVKGTEEELCGPLTKLLVLDVDTKEWKAEVEERVPPRMEDEDETELDLDDEDEMEHMVQLYSDRTGIMLEGREVRGSHSRPCSRCHDCAFVYGDMYYTECGREWDSMKYCEGCMRSILQAFHRSIQR
eukprot:jgi/Tetstr1/433326/TSEL_022612.t2